MWGNFRKSARFLDDGCRVAAPLDEHLGADGRGRGVLHRYCWSGTSLVDSAVLRYVPVSPVEWHLQTDFDSLHRHRLCVFSLEVKIRTYTDHIQ